MKSHRSMFLWALPIFLLILCGTAFAEVGVTNTEIHIGQWGPQTGPAAAWGSVARGTDAYFKMINDEGGIHGRKLIHHMFDDAYNPAKTKAGVKELQEGIGMFAWVSGVGSAPGLAVMDYLMERKIPWIGPSAGSLNWIEPPKKYLFAVYPLYYMEAKTLVRYAVKNLGTKKVAIAYQNDEYGKNGLKGAMEELRAFGLESVAEVPVEITDTDVKPHVMKLRKSEADMVLLWTSVSHAVRIVGTSKAMQFTPQFMSTSTCSDFPLMMAITKGLWEGVICATFGELPDSENPLLKKYKEKAYGQYAAKDERWGLFYYAGILFAEPLVEAIRRAGPELTREKLVASLEQMQNFRGIGPTVSYKPFDANDPMCRQGTKETILIRCGPNGVAEKLTDWVVMAD